MQPNDIIKDRYELLRPLGSGGFGEVWLAKDQMTGTQCAIKFYVRLDDAGRSEFRGEYSRMLGIHHPNLLTASYYDEWQGRPFLVMDYCGGGAASGKVGQLGETELWRLIRDVASGLACLHSQCDARGKEAPVIHQDIKPANFLQKNDGTWLISDFGISSRMRSSMSSQSGREVSSGGTIPYMGPERFGQGKMLVKSSDIWALGASIYEMATRGLPFDEYGGMLQKKGEEIPHLSRESWSSDLDRLVNSCLQKETWDRPSAALVAEYADCKLKGRPLPKLPKETPQPPKPNPNPDPKPKLWKWITVAGTVVAVVLAIVLWPKPSIDPEPLIDPDTQAFEACETVNDYRAYLSDYGRNALHYADAKAFIDNYEVDSTAKAQQALADAQAQHQAEAEAKAQAEAEKKEEAAYKKCTTIAACESYLKAYPQGRYLTEVRAKKTKLEEQEAEAKAEHEAEQKEKAAYEKCTTITACENYLRAYPQGRYVAEVRAKKANLEAQAAQSSGISTSNGHEYVDLGLPSGTLWATCNVGASKPEDYGSYFAWGETSTKSTYNWSTYKYANGHSHRLTKYCDDSEFGNNGFTDKLITLQTGDDPASANWGSDWHTPSKAQWDELLANATNEWTIHNGVEGRLFTSKNNGNTLFLPAAGDRCDTEFSNVYGLYWSRSLYADYPHYPYIAWSFYFKSDKCYVRNDDRSRGFSVRPVRKK